MIIVNMKRQWDLELLSFINVVAVALFSAPLIIQNFVVATIFELLKQMRHINVQKIIPVIRITLRDHPDIWSVKSLLPEATWAMHTAFELDKKN